LKAKIYGKNGNVIDVITICTMMDDEEVFKLYNESKDFNKWVYEAIKTLGLQKWGEFDCYELISEIDFIIMERRNHLDWYVLHYDTETTAYLNEIEFMTYEKALEKYNKEEPFSSTDRVELMFSPNEDDEEFEENVLIYYKIKEE
jgi:hypothetical protein